MIKPSCGVQYIFIHSKLKWKGMTLESFLIPLQEENEPYKLTKLVGAISIMN